MALPPMLLHAHPGASTTIEHFTHQIEHQPDEQLLYIRRGIAYSADGQYEQALSDFERAETLGDPLLVSFDLGVLHYRRGEFDTALGYFNRYLQRFPNHSACLEYRARLLRDQGNYKESVADFLRVFELEQRPNPGHYISVAQMLASGGGNGTQQALQVLDDGTIKLGLTPQLQFYAIELETERGRPDLAVKRMQALQNMLGDSPDWKVGMAELYYDNKQVEAAEKWLDSAERQLVELRRTPARIALQQRIIDLRERSE
jgi:tetratricopeptide (TPR) repeat protein